MKNFLLVMTVLVVVLMISKEPRVAEAACNPTELAPCWPALTTSAQPTYLCCKNLRNQQPCLCGYLRDPSYRRLVQDSHVAQKFSSKCGVSIPKCSLSSATLS